MSKARVLITKRCNRGCPQCCNSYSRIMAHADRIRNLNELWTYSEIYLTGGEPMIDVPKTMKIIAFLRDAAPRKIFLYTALYRSGIEFVIEMLDGLQFTLHNPANRIDVEGLYSLQNILDARKWKDKSFRLSIESEVSEAIVIKPWVWNRVRIAPWKTEDELIAKTGTGLPEGEDLYIYEE